MVEFRYTLLADGSSEWMLIPILTWHCLQSSQIRPYRVAELIDDFTPLRALSAFHALETELHAVTARQGWA
jgi:hypothetical protein